MDTDLSSFGARLRRLIDQLELPRPEPGLAQFDALALELFALQFQYNPVYRKLCAARGLAPATAGRWTDLPFVPTAVFKELELSCIPPGERTAVFHSSGTTGQKPSRHFHCAESLAVYEASLRRWFAPHFSGEGSLLFLTPPPGPAPHSSLVHMFGTIGQTARSGGFFGRVGADGAWEIAAPAVGRALGEACAAGRPVHLLGTAFSFVHLLDFLAEQDVRFVLPAGSRVMETGGYKNRSRVLPKAELHELLEQRLGVSPENIVCEYGMSELSSQAYAVGGPPASLPGAGVFRFPPWARAQITSPETGAEVAEGQAGLIRVLDLANVYSVAAIQTQDLGIRRGGGFELLGRAEPAEPRGCSLMTAG